MPAATPNHSASDALRRVREHLRATLSTGATCQGYVVATSGGLDSSVLLHALSQIDLPGKAPIRALHVNHALQSAAPQFEQQAKALADRLQVPFSVLHIHVPPSAQGLEGEARLQRYAALQQALQPGEWLLTAHHDDDQAETVLSRLARAAGSAALLGIAPSRPLPPGQLCRPLLGLGRTDLHAYAMAAGLSWCDDPMNADLDLERSFLRHQVLPLLRSRWPAFAEQTARSAALLQPAIRAAEAATAQHLARAQTADPNVLDLDMLLAESDEVVLAVVRAWLTRLGLARPGARWLHELLRQLRAGSDALHLETLQFWVRQYRRNLYAGPQMQGAAPVIADDQDWDGRDPLLWSNHRVYHLSQPIVPGLQVRYRRGGERIRLRDAGRMQEVRDLFQRHGLPPWERDLPFFFVQGELLAVGDLWQSEAFRRHLGSAQLRSAPRWPPT